MTKDLEKHYAPNLRDQLHAIRLRPEFGSVLLLGTEDDEIWKIVRYIHNLPEKSVLGIPEVFKEEEEQHKETVIRRCSPPAPNRRTRTPPFIPNSEP